MNLGLSGAPGTLHPQHLAGCSLSVSCPDPQGASPTLTQLKTLPSQCISNFLFSSRTLFLQVKRTTSKASCEKVKRTGVWRQSALREKGTLIWFLLLSWRNLLNKVRNQQVPQRSWLELKRMLISAKVES